MTNSLGFIYSMLHRRRASLSLEQGLIRFSAPKDALRDADLCLLRENKLKLTCYLTAKSAPRFTIKPAIGSVQIKPTMLQDVWRRLCLRSNDSIPDTTLSLLIPISNATEELALKLMTRLITRHDVLRFKFSEFDNGETAMLNEPATFRLDPTIDVASSEDLEGIIRTVLAEEVDVLNPWLIRARVISGPGNQRFLIVLIHHAICDGYSVSLLRRDLLTLFSGEQLSDGSRVPFIDILLSEQNWIRSESFVPLANFWRQWGSEIPPFVVLPENKILTCQPGKVISFAIQLSRREVERLFRASRQPSGFRSLLALFAIALSEWAGIRRFSIRSMRNMRGGGPLAETVGLLMRHDYIDIDLPGKIEFPEAVALISQDLNCTMAINIPTGVYGDELDFDRLGYKAAPIINYTPAAPSSSSRLRKSQEETSKRPQVVGTREWKVPATPIFLRVKHATPFDVFVQLDINSAVVSEEEGQRLAEGLLANLRRIAANL